MSLPKSIEEVKSVYQLGYYIKEIYKSETKPSLIAAVQSVLTKAKDDKQKELLGIEAYVEKIMCEKKLEKRDFQEFTGIIDYLFPKEFDKTIEEKSNLLEELLTNKTLTKEYLIAANLTQNYFPIKEFENFIKQIKIFKIRKN